MTWLSRAAISRRSVTVLIAAGLFLAGILSWGSLKQELVPAISFPIVTIIAPYPGAAADEVVEDVVAPVENAVQSIEGIDTVNSTSANSIGFIIAQFAFGTDVDAAVADLEDAVNGLELPDGVEPAVTPFDFNQTPVVIAGISASSASLTELGLIASEEILTELEAIPGVADAEITGGLSEQVEITLDPAALATTGIGPMQVQAALGAANVTVPAGQLETDDTALPVTVTATVEQVEALNDLVVGADQSGGTPLPVTLGQIASIEVIEVAATGYGFINGEEALGLTVSKTGPANTVEVSQAVGEALDEIIERHEGLEIDIVSDQATFIIESRDGLLREGGLGALFAILTIFFFLFSVRSTFVAALSIPLSLLVALIVMQFTGITINILTLGGLAVAVGRVVDDSIVVLENIYRHRAIGDDRLTASLRGPSEVAGAITWSTLTTVAVFLPLGLAGGFVSQFFLPFALTVTFALLASLIVALTVVPVLAYFWVGVPREEVDASGEPKRSIWVRLYDPTIRFVLGSRLRSAATIGIAFLLFVATLALAPLIPVQFINAGSEKLLTVSLGPPSGATSEDVRDRAVDAQEIILADDDVELVQTTVPPEGDTGFRTLIAAASGRPANSAQLFVRLDSEADLEATAQRLDDELGAIESDGWDATVQEATGAAGGSSDAALVVSGPDTETVEAAAATVVDALNSVDGLGTITTDLVAEARQVVVTVDPARAGAAGVSAPQVAGVIGGVLSPIPAGTIEPAEADDPLEVILRFDSELLTSVDALQAIPVGPGVTVGDVADVEEVDARPTISRVDAAPSATVTAEITDENTGAVSTAIAAEVDRLDASAELPAGVSIQIGGVSEQLAESFGGLLTAMGIAILLVYLMLVLAFNSLLTPFIILFTLPLAIIGAFPALLLTGRPLGISALIGFLMLIGIVVTNAIVLLDLVVRLRAEGVPLHEALIRGAHTRVRPILMTAIATIFALLPLAAGFNEGSIIAAELGTVVIGGLLSSTFLTLLVIPASYLLIEGWRERRRATKEVSFQRGALESESG